jgi:hypothetical protein
MRRLVAVPAVLAFTLLLGGTALADPEWCDDGSPPPNDWRLRPTGAGSFTSGTSWLHSTTGGTFDPSAGLPAGLGTLTGGVAHGMRTALDHARPYDTLPLQGHRAKP